MKTIRIIILIMEIMQCTNMNVYTCAIVNCEQIFLRIASFPVSITNEHEHELRQRTKHDTTEKIKVRHNFHNAKNDLLFYFCYFRFIFKFQNNHIYIYVYTYVIRNKKYVYKNDAS